MEWCFVAEFQEFSFTFLLPYSLCSMPLCPYALMPLSHDPPIKTPHTVRTTYIIHSSLLIKTEYCIVKWIFFKLFILFYEKDILYCLYWRNYEKDILLCIEKVHRRAHNWKRTYCTYCVLYVLYVLYILYVLYVQCTVYGRGWKEYMAYGIWHMAYGRERDSPIYGIYTAIYWYMRPKYSLFSMLLCYSSMLYAYMPYAICHTLL
jgi:hypothetical protein